MVKEDPVRFEHPPAGLDRDVVREVKFLRLLAQAEDEVRNPRDHRPFMLVRWRARARAP
jgi:hypothetical protein